MYDTRKTLETGLAARSSNERVLPYTRQTSSIGFHEVLDTCRTAWSSNQRSMTRETLKSAQNEAGPAGSLSTRLSTACDVLEPDPTDCIMHGQRSLATPAQNRLTNRNGGRPSADRQSICRMKPFGRGMISRIEL